MPRSPCMCDTLCAHGHAHARASRLAHLSRAGVVAGHTSRHDIAGRSRSMALRSMQTNACAARGRGPSSAQRCVASCRELRDPLGGWPCSPCRCHMWRPAMPTPGKAVRVRARVRVHHLRSGGSRFVRRAGGVSPSGCTASHDTDSLAPATAEPGGACGMGVARWPRGEAIWNLLYSRVYRPTVVRLCVQETSTPRCRCTVDVEVSAQPLEPFLSSSYTNR